MNSVDIRDSLVSALSQDLVGPMSEREVIESPPSRWYLTGFLVPRGAPAEQRVDPTAVEELSNAPESDAADDGGDNSPTSRRPFLPSSMGISVLVPPGTRTLQVQARWGEYAQLDEDTTREYRDKERSRWKKDDPEDSPPKEPEDDEEDEIRFLYWQRLEQKVIDLPVKVQNRDLPIPLPGSDGVMLRVVVRVADAPGLPAGTQAVSLFLVNHRDPITGRGADERYLFQAELRMRCKKGFLPRNRYEATDHPDDLRNDLQFRDRNEWAVGHGVAAQAMDAEDDRAKAMDAEDDRAKEVRTTWFPTARVYRMKAESVEGVTLEMERLAEMSGEDLRHGMSALSKEYRGWIKIQRDQIPTLKNPRREQTAESLLAAATTAIERIEAGIAVLESDPVALQAFHIANRAMALAARKTRPHTTPQWRLFQLAFVLLNIASTTHPDDPYRDSVELLFFPTGGGKTEAYLGVAAFVMVLRRLRGRGTAHEGGGVAVLLRYTLRLLTLDQLTRAARLICALELERRADVANLGRHRFSVGLWVGRKATHNRLSAAVSAVNEFRRRRWIQSGPPPIPITNCPWCDAPLKIDEHIDFWPNRTKPQAMLIVCSGGTYEDPCPFGEDEDAQSRARIGLPIIVVDDHLYRELPTLMVGTVDKFASLPWRAEVGMLFGRVRCEGLGGFRGMHEKRGHQDTALPEGLPPPELVIQDELHLISGPLGTMVGLYETAIDALSRDASGHGPKIIASTATARRATEQIQALFARPHTALFPPQGLDDGDTFFARVDKREEKSRLYVGVAAPGRSVKALLARTYSDLLSAAQRHWEDAGSYQEGVDNPADTYMTLVAYFNALRELGGAQRLIMEEVAPRVSRLERRRPLDEVESTWFRRRWLDFDVLELTSRQSTDGVRKTKDRLDAPFRSERAGKTDVLLASSMISVGVDISRLGLMVMNGQPRTVAEYIQATSRVGRDTPGLVVTLFNVFRPRDRSHYERFTAFHESFYRFVEASSVTPFSARALERGLAGLSVGLARHLGQKMAPNPGVMLVKQDTELIGKLADIVTARVLAHRVNVPAELAERVRQQLYDLFAEWHTIVDSMIEAGGLLRYSPWEKPKSVQALLSTEVDDLVGDLAEHLDEFRAPTSMRNVEPTVHLWVDIPQSRAAE